VDQVNQVQVEAGRDRLLWSKTGQICSLRWLRFGWAVSARSRERTLVKYWSNTGQILVKYWSIAGQMLVKYWSNAGRERTPQGGRRTPLEPPHPSQAGNEEHAR
jgi:hypothetical protein